MGETPGLAQQLTDQRSAAENSVRFFDNVGPLARRLGMENVPSGDMCRNRLIETEDLDTDRLRADGRIVLGLQTVAATELHNQTGQDAVLGTCWPTGSGIVARTRLQDAHIPRAAVDVAALADIGSGMVVAADAIEAARLAKFWCVAAITPDSLLGIPISSWLTLVTTPGSPAAELTAAIDSTVALFNAAVTLCDDAIDAVLTGLCTAMAKVDVSDYAGGDCAREQLVSSDETLVRCAAHNSEPIASERDCHAAVDVSGPGDGVRESSGITTVSAPAPDSGPANSTSVCEPGAQPVKTTQPVTTTQPVMTAQSGVASPLTPMVGADLSAVLGSVAVAVGSAVAGSITGVIEMVANASGAVMLPPASPAGTEHAADAGGVTDEPPVSTPLGDKGFDLNGSSASGAPDCPAPQVSSGPPDAGPPGEQACETTPADGQSKIGDDLTFEEQPPVPATPDDPEPPDAAEMDRDPVEQCPSPGSPGIHAPRSKDDVDTPGAPGNPDATPVTPQASERDAVALPDDGLLALAGEQ
ncbi:MULTISPECIES: hypothetical protein [Actinomycetes]|uniref:hypothetical protein n=1 Tax=Actinomycetes TaxID=1760 RepID=UPI000A84F395|nr:MULTISPECIES: hypothetical protein [Actinomycetes]